MSYNVVSPEYLIELDRFLPGIGNHATIIKYETVTPDLYLLCFKTNGKDGNDYYFCMLEYDFINTIRYATKIINNYFAKVIEYMPPVVKQKGRTQLEQKTSLDSQKNNRYLLARTVRPKGKGYWASYITFMPGDEIAPKLTHLSEIDRLNVRKCLVSIFAGQPPAGEKTNPADFMGSWQKKIARGVQSPEGITVNDTRLAINVFKNASGAWESFFNYVK